VDQVRLRAEQQTAGGGVVVTVTGEIDVDTSDILADALARAADVAAVVVADLTAVTFMDSTGLNTLLGAHRDLAARGGRLALVGAQPAVRRVLELTGVDTVIPLYPSTARALHPRPPGSWRNSASWARLCPDVPARRSAAVQGRPLSSSYRPSW
jgi:anti-anti-sigma factor